MENCDTISRILKSLRNEEKQIRDFKKILEQELERLRIEELNMQAQTRIKNIEKERHIAQEHSSTEKDDFENMSVVDHSNNHQSPLMSNNENTYQVSKPSDQNMFDFEVETGCINLPDFI